MIVPMFSIKLVTVTVLLEIAFIPRNASLGWMIVMVTYLNG